MPLVWYGEQDVNSIPTWKLSYITLAYISELIKLAKAQNTSFKITLNSNINNSYSNDASPQSLDT